MIALLLLMACNAGVHAVGINVYPSVWWFRPVTAFSSHTLNPYMEAPAPAAPPDGKTFATAWINFKSIQWSGFRPGDTLCVHGIGDGSVYFPSGLSDLILDGGCSIPPQRAKGAQVVQPSAAAEASGRNVQWFGGKTIPFDGGAAPGWTVASAPHRIYRILLAEGADASSYASEITPPPHPSAAGGTRPNPTAARLHRANCTAAAPARPEQYVPGSFCMALHGGQQVLFYKPQGDAVAALQLESLVGISLINATRVTLRRFDVSGPASRTLDLAGGGVGVSIEQCSFQWASFAAIAINYKSVSGMGCNNTRIVSNRMSNSGCGLYIVNQARAFDASANSNHLYVANNTISELDQVENLCAFVKFWGFFAVRLVYGRFTATPSRCVTILVPALDMTSQPRRYKSRDNLAIGIQGGVSNLFEHNTISNIAGSCITFYQGPGQVFADNVLSRAGASVC
jgi:hypothetical protein